MSQITLQLTPWKLTVCKLATDALPIWCQASRFLNYTKTADEWSLVCESHVVPTATNSESGWNCLKVDGVLDFSLIGIIAGITAVLAAEKISVFVISTHDTDYILVKEEKHVQAIEALKSNGYCITETDAPV